MSVISFVRRVIGGSDVRTAVGPDHPLPVGSGLAMPIARKIVSTQESATVSRYDYYNAEDTIIAVLRITDDGVGNATYERIS